MSLLRRSLLVPFRRTGAFSPVCRFSTPAAEGEAVPAPTPAPAAAAAEAPAVPAKPRHTKTKTKYAPMQLFPAIDLIKSSAWAKFDETVEILIRTGLDPRKPNQSVKGVATLPHGTGKKVRVCVIAKEADAKLALEAGAEIAGLESVIAQISSGQINFDTVIATPDVMPMVGKLGRILGPRGLMPNPKMGTVSKDVVSAVKAMKAGSVTFKTEKHGNIQAIIGKVSFPKEALLENLRTLMVAVNDARPPNYKGSYIRRTILSSTMGPGVPVEAGFLDPSKPKFMLEL